MLQHETLAWAIHADRVREMERAARDRRLLATTSEPQGGECAAAWRHAGSPPRSAKAATG